MKKPAILILAAGTSSRMGQPKQLLPFQDHTILGTVLQNCLKSEVQNIFCVLGASALKIQERHIFPKVQFIVNAAYENGMSTSIVCGVQAIINNCPEVSHLLILLGDQPFISSRLIKNYFQAHRTSHSQTIGTAYGTNRVGVPAVFPKQHFDSLLKLQGDQGARELLESIEDTCILTQTKPSLRDIDTIEEYRQSQQTLNQ